MCVCVCLCIQVADSDGELPLHKAAEAGRNVLVYEA
jgi:hypothetical protein